LPSECSDPKSWQAFAHRESLFSSLHGDFALLDARWKLRIAKRTPFQLGRVRILR
jgi:hypothetical protein